MIDAGVATNLILGLIGSALTFLAYRLNRRGQAEENRQRTIARKMDQKAQAFEQLESLNLRLAEENARLRTELGRQEQAEDKAVHRQANLCRAQLEAVLGAMATLQNVVVSEVATVSAQRSIETALEHIELYHRPEDER